MLILGFAVFGAWTLWHSSDLSFFKVSALAGAFSLLVLYALSHLRPGVRSERDALIVRNFSATYTIPWASIRDVDAGRGIHLRIEGRQKPLSLEAFNGWPAVGRAVHIRDEIDVARRTSVGEPSGEVVEVPSRGYTELVLVILIVVMLGALLFEGARWLIDR
ncbi:PH domain-containing protein [Streptomyces sp. NBC_00343]|uniref:PH domain-containing protein n=1 Tax=Streptomyces sp. NBC_00343 TaxID=2975719 RepID=UPI002E28A98C|nr:PH domain-containing protein [Streptomyces sp. NBC_00343]